MLLYSISILCILFWMFGSCYAMYGYDVWINARCRCACAITMPIMLCNDPGYNVYYWNFVYAGKEAKQRKKKLCQYVRRWLGRRRRPCPVPNDTAYDNFQ